MFFNLPFKVLYDLILNYVSKLFLPNTAMYTSFSFAEIHTVSLLSLVPPLLCFCFLFPDLLKSNSPLSVKTSSNAPVPLSLPWASQPEPRHLSPSPPLLNIYFFPCPLSNHLSVLSAWNCSSQCPAALPSPSRGRPSLCPINHCTFPRALRLAHAW